MNATNVLYRTRGLILMVGIVVLVGLLFSPAASSTDHAPRIPAPIIDIPLATFPGEATMVVAGGCFWGVQAVFQHVIGVKSAISGYSGGDAEHAKYELVSRGDTGHAESVSVVYDPSKVSYGQLLRVFFSVAHDPTQLNRQGPDTGTQYRSAVFYTNEQQQHVTAAYLDQLERAKIFPGRVVTETKPLTSFYPAEGYHQNYLALHPNDLYIVINDLPKLKQLKATFPAFYRADAKQ